MSPRNQKSAPTPADLSNQVAWLRQQLEWVAKEVGKFDGPVATAVRVILQDPRGGGDGR